MGYSQNKKVMSLPPDPPRDDDGFLSVNLKKKYRKNDQSNNNY